MSSTELSRFLSAASSGRLNRRQVLERGLGLGVSSAMIMSLMESAPAATAAPSPGSRPFLTASQDDDPGVLTVCFMESTTDIDPHSSYTTYGAVVCLASYDMLVNYKGVSTTEIEPMLAESWTASDDQTTFSFKIRANATFHDGSPCTADDVKASFIRFRRLELGPYQVIARFCDDPENQITVDDPTTVTFNLTSPQPLFLPAMASSYGPFVVNPRTVEANKTDDDPWANGWFIMNADGTGPYKLIENNLDEGMKFERHEGYWGTFPEGGFHTIRVRVVPENATRRQLAEQGELDLITQSLTEEDHEALRSNSALQVLTYPTTRVDWFILNYVTLSLEARQGLAWAFPYDEVVKGVYKDTVKRTGPISDNVQGYDPEAFLYTTDLEQARTLLETAGLVNGDSITILIDSESEKSRTISELFQANLAEIGVTLELEAVDYATQEAIVYGDMPAEEKQDMIGLWSWWPDYNEGWNQLYPNFVIESAGGNASNGGYYNNPSVEELMVQARDVATTEEKDALMKEIQDILIRQDPAAIFIGQVLYTTVADATIKGLEFNPLYIEQYFFHRYYRETTA
jgi:peptide/nickel transport system substrate-binding protein